MKFRLEFDWTVPKEWNIKTYIKNLNGQRIVDFRDSNLHVVNYSVPIRDVFGELKSTFSLPNYLTGFLIGLPLHKAGAFASVTNNI